MILCAGEALIDMLPRESTAGEPCFAPVAGGSVFNTSVALGRLGVAAGLFTGLSRDLFGQRLDASLAAAGVDAATAVRSDRPTTLAFVELADGQARYAFYDENTAHRMLTEADLPPPAALDGVSALFFGGISLMVEPCASAYAALMAREARRRVTMLDPNIRPSFIADAEAYQARIWRMLGDADIVKISDEDLAWLLGPGDAVDRARTLLDRGPRLVCVTEGARGVTAHHAAGHLHVPAPRVTVVDTVGAGDTFNAGLLAGLDDAGALAKGWFDAPDEDVLEAALGLGVSAAAVTVSRAGANPPTRAELA
ncbi:MAG: carbohydrate kinase [Deinococcus-Thermus bacterium]|jgi:fructokinase|nr:carbohydrate kinase [Deinococcota bacterium]